MVNLVSRLARLAVYVGILVSAQFSVTQAATYYVSPSGSDSNPGTSAKPFQTISKAASVLLAGDTCLIRSGTYRETVSPANDGTLKSPITFAAQKGADVVIAGSDPVPGWTVYKGDIYSAPVTGLEGDAQVYTNDSNGFNALQEARWPHISAWDLTDIHNGMAFVGQGSNTSVADPKLTQPDGFWDGATVWVRGGYAWLPQTSTVRRFDAATHTLSVDSFQSGAGLDPVAGDDYYITNCLNALDVPGEYYYDKTAGTLYVWAASGLAPANIEIKRRTTAFNLDGRSFVVIRGLHILGANVTLLGSNNCAVENVTAKYVAYSDTSVNYLPENQMRTGFAIKGDNNVIRDSDIGWSTGCLVSIDGDGNRIINDYIHDGDLIGTYAPLVYMASGSRNLISNNTIKNCGRYGIFFGSSNSNVEYNDVSDYMALSEDGGGLYCWGVDLENSHIDHNIVHDSKDFRSGNGIYLDNYDENSVVDHNVIWGCDNNGITLNTPSSYELVYNNTIDRCTMAVNYWGQAPYDQDLYGVRVFNNLFVSHTLFPKSVATGNNCDGVGAAFTNSSADDYTLTKESSAIGKGVVIPGITDGYAGTAPDCGAYQYGAKQWKAGWNPSDRPDPKFVQVNVRYMNRVQNSGFETGLTHWTKTGSMTATVIGVPGQYPWQNRGKSLCLSLGAGLNGVSQTISGLTPNTVYKLSAWVYANPGETYSLSVSGFGDAPVTISDSNQQYSLKELIFRTGNASTTASVSLNKTSSGAGAVVADDFGVAEN